MPLRVQKLFDEYNNPGSFAVASLLTSLALVTLFAKVALERKTRREIAVALSVEAPVAMTGADPRRETQ
jgi:sulfate transport system permease protein